MVEHGDDRGPATATATGGDVKGAGAATGQAPSGEQGEFRQQASRRGIPLAQQGFAGGHDRFQFRIAPVGRKQALLQVQGPTGQGTDRIAGCGGDLGGQVEQHGQLAPGYGPIGQGLDQGLLVACTDGIAAQSIEPGHQARPLQIEAFGQDHEIVVHGGLIDAHRLVRLLQLEIGLAHLQLQAA